MDKRKLEDEEDKNETNKHIKLDGGDQENENDDDANINTEQHDDEEDDDDGDYNYDGEGEGEGGGDGEGEGEGDQFSDGDFQENDHVIEEYNGPKNTKDISEFQIDDNILILNHQDGPIYSDFDKGGYCIQDVRIKQK
jgi:hypothetical protein